MCKKKNESQEYSKKKNEHFNVCVQIRNDRNLCGKILEFLTFIFDLELLIFGFFNCAFKLEFRIWTILVSFLSIAITLAYSSCESELMSFPREIYSIKTRREKKSQASFFREKISSQIDIFIGKFDFFRELSRLDFFCHLESVAHGINSVDIN